jgi:hypothetical protein
MLQYVPKLFGFKIREYAEIHRWQDQAREQIQRRQEAYENGTDGEEAQ